MIAKRLLIPCFVVSIALQAQAQSSADFSQRLGRCDAQNDRSKRLLCFERVARDAVAELEKRLPMALQVPPTQAPAASAPSRPQTNKYADFVASAKSNLVRDFKDPGTVQWRNLFVSEGNMLALCGEVNAKNSYGAYIGFRRFIATSEARRQEIEKPNDSVVLERMWESMCRQELQRVE